MFTQLHIMQDSCIYSKTELNGIYFTFKFHHHTFCQLVARQFEREKLLTSFNRQLLEAVSSSENSK